MHVIHKQILMIFSKEITQYDLSDSTIKLKCYKSHITTNALAIELFLQLNWTTASAAKRFWV